MVDAWMGGARFTLLVQFEVGVDDRSVFIESSNEWSLLARLALETGHCVAVRARLFGHAEPAPMNGEAELVRMFAVAG